MASRDILQNMLDTQISNLQGFEFQAFIVSVLGWIHGPHGFTNLREVKDAGCDGIVIVEACAVACYGPGDVSVARAKKKISGDYAKYKARWHAEYPNWRLFINREPGPDHLSMCHSLHGASDVIWGLSRVIGLIRSLNPGLRLECCRALRIPEDVVARDFVRLLLEDLLADRIDRDSIRYAKTAPDIELKVRTNYPPMEVDATLKKMLLTVEQQAEVDAAVRSLSGGDAGTLKRRVLQDFEFAPGASFGHKLEALANTYGERYNPGTDDGMQSYIYALLFHLFAQCLLGAEPATL